MATQLKNLKFGDYTLKGTQVGSEVNYSLGPNDSFVDASNNNIIYYDAGCSNMWVFNGYANEAGAVGSIGGSALYYDNDSYVWKFKGVADSALGFIERTSGSPGYYHFYNAISLPSTVPTDGYEAAAWIANLLSSLGGNSLVTCTQP